MRGPVRLEQLTTRDYRLARGLIREAAMFAAAITGQNDGHRVAELAEAAATMMFEGCAERGLEIEGLCEKRIGSSHIRDEFGPTLDHTVELAARAIQYAQRRPIIHERIFSMPLRAGRESQALGVDKLRGGAPRGAHIVGVSLAAGDREVPARAMPLTTGTHDDRTSPRGDVLRIARFASELGEPVPATLVEHLDRLLVGERCVRDHVDRARDRRAGDVGRLQVDLERLRANYLPWCLILGQMPFGAPPAKGQISSGTLFPGDDDDVIECLRSHHKHGVARCRLHEPALSAAPAEALVAQLELSLGERLAPITAEQLFKVGAMPVARALGVNISWATRYWWAKDAQRLVRLAVPPEAPGATDLSIWRIVELESMLHAAIILIERAVERWPDQCLARYVKSCEPGKMKPHSARSRQALLDISLLANAGVVAADRYAQAVGG